MAGNHYKLGGVVSLRGRADGMGNAVGLPPIPGTITMDVGGIDLFHTLLMLVFAHKYSPYVVGPDASEAAILENRKAAWAVLKARVLHLANGTPIVGLTYEYPDAIHAQYTLRHPQRGLPLVVRVDPRAPVVSCLRVLMPTGTFVTVDLSRLRLSTPDPAAASAG